MVAGGPDLGAGSMKERLEVFRERLDHFRSAIVNEPRGNDAMVGALLCEPVDPACAAGVIFFNNVGFLGMCGHGTIGLMATLRHLGRIEPGVHRIETPVGLVEAELHAEGDVTITNVASYRQAAGVRVGVPGYGEVVGDVAWGGNWFFLTMGAPVELTVANLEHLTDYAWAIRQAVNDQGYPDVDHVEVFGPPVGEAADSRNFVLCPGKAWDRSPCGTGTSAKVACLYADGKLAEGQVWRQESVIGSAFEASVTVVGGVVRPRIRGAAFVNAETQLILDDADPFQWGIR